MATRKISRVEPEIVNYDTSHLDGYVEEGEGFFVADEPDRPQLPARQNMVLPVRQDNTQNTALVNALTQVLAQQQSNGAMDAHAIKHMQMMSEKSTPEQRSKARLVQWGGIVIVCGIVAIGLYQAGIQSPMAWGIFACSVAVWVIKINQDENKHSPAGVERHKSDTYRDIRLAELKVQDKADERRHATFGRVMDTVHGVNNADRRKNR
jgi:hypothetical protein